MTVIPGLPPRIREVPPAPNSPDDPEGDRKRAAWHAWRDAVVADNADYHELFVVLDGPERDALIAREATLCAAHPAYWLVRWGRVFEPRATGGRGGDLSFVPFACQVDLLDWFLARLDATGADADGVVSKSRDMGASWLMCAFALWGWLFRSPWQVRLVSRKEDLVDARNPDSLFWKIDYLLDRLPGWMVPVGFERKLHRLKLHLENPANGNVIAGESTTAKSVRGGRATWVGYDEFAFMPEGDAAWSAGANSTEHRFAVSTESLDEGPHFYNLRTGNEMPYRPALFELDWWQHPHHDPAWRDDMKRRYANDPAAFHREVERDPHAGTTTWVYARFWDPAYEPDPAIRLLPAGDLYGGMDPGFRDQFALLWCQDDPLSGHFHVLDAYMGAGEGADFYAPIINGGLDDNEFAVPYDDEAYRLMGFTRQLAGRNLRWIGDAYGHNVQGATTDSVYSRLYRHGIRVNRDRLADKDLSPFRVQARTHRGRQEAVRALLPRIRFADTPGARLALKALRHYRFRKEDRPTMVETRAPEHDWASHLASCLEYVAVYLMLRRRSALGGYAPPTASAMGKPALPPKPVPLRAVS